MKVLALFKTELGLIRDFFIALYSTLKWWNSKHQSVMKITGFKKFIVLLNLLEI